MNQFFLEQVAYVARKLDAVQEGERTLLDNTMLLYCSSMRTGNHDNDELPVVLLGGGGGQVRGGRVLDYRQQPERQVCRLFLSLLARCGLQLPSFGDAALPLAEI